MLDLFLRLFHTLFPLTQDKLLNFIQYAGPIKFQVLLCVILFCETGLVVTPFLPGDSLLFAVGAIGVGSAIFNLPVLTVCLLGAVLLGDNTNYWIGRSLGPAVFHYEKSKLFNKKYLLKAHSFYETYGAKTIILARFVPIVRTFAPFVAGVGTMNYAKFFVFSLLGAIAWVTICVGAGSLLGNVDFVKKHFEVVALVIVFISIIPMGIEAWKHRKPRPAA
ncbi:MAG TPA: VTT domain-containing protein [Tepidisphaeraceae bacterium]|jgi:membrane-associated protein